MRDQPTGTLPGGAPAQPSAETRDVVDGRPFAASRDATLIGSRAEFQLTWMLLRLQDRVGRLTMIAQLAAATCFVLFACLGRVVLGADVDGHRFVFFLLRTAA